MLCYSVQTRDLHLKKVPTSEIVEKKIPGAETPVNRVLISLKLAAPLFAHLDFITQNG